VGQVGHIVCISDYCSIYLIRRVLNPSNLKVIHLSSIHPDTVVDPNRRADSHGGEINNDIALVLESGHDFNDDTTKLYTSSDNPPPPSIIDMEELIGRSFMMYEQEDGQKLPARIVKLIEDHGA
jgi:hypothetical protein